MSAPRNARARVRAELVREITAAAREELQLVGAAALSLRAVARRLEMVPSALYRYFPSRDALLTALIVESFGGLARAATAADRTAGPDPLGRWLAVTAAVRDWARRHPREWALVYGSPVPGYQAPPDTVPPAVEVIEAMARVFRDAGVGGPTAALPPAPPGLGPALAPTGDALLPGWPPELVAAALMAWTQAIGTVSLELFGHFVGATTDFDEFFGYAMTAAARAAGLPGA